MKVIRSSTLEKLIKACKKDNRQAQRKLYDKFAPVMLGLCRNYARNNMEAEEIMINGFIKVFGKIDQFEHKGSFEGWVKRIMINESINYLKTNTQLYVANDIDEISDEPEYDTLGSQLEEEDLLRMIGELPPGYRSVFNLYVIEGYTHQEISELMDISVSTSKSQLRKARFMLQKRLASLEDKLNSKRSYNE